MRYLLVTGGVISGLGKGITASSLGVLLQAHGCTVTAIKIDPYLNQDSGTISPFEHGECFVLTDGTEADLDLGSYERFLQVPLANKNSITTGKIYKQVLSAERHGEYLGATVQIVPHITDTIISKIRQAAAALVNVENSVCIVELGGTVGDIESLPFLEALRQMVYGNEDTFCHVHVSYVPVLKTTAELKTKPTQESVKNVRRYGINPDFLCLRCETDIPSDTLHKIQKFCGIPESHILKNVDVSNIYHVPVQFANVIGPLWNTLRLSSAPLENSKWTAWKKLDHDFEQDYPTLKIGVVGKYTGLRDSYLSLCHAIKHAAVALKRSANIMFIEASGITEQNCHTVLHGCDAIVIPGGFGQRGIEGMITAANYTRKHAIPTLGICLGMQVMVIEWVRAELDWKDANSTEFCKETTHPMLIVMSDNPELGGTMRLGHHHVHFNANSRTAQFYECDHPKERHRHRYEVNPDYHDQFNNEFVIAATDKSGKRVEVMEHCSHPFYIGCQFHPELQTYPGSPHPVFYNFLKAGTGTLNQTSANRSPCL